jgi:hypothetical protein
VNESGAAIPPPPPRGGSPLDPNKKTVIVPFTPDRLPSVRGFCERYWDRPRTDAFYAWRYLQPQPRVRMLLALQDDECLGMLTALQKTYRINGQPATCLEIFDWHTLPGLRGTGVGIRLMRPTMRMPERVFAVGGTADVQATLPKMGWEAIGSTRVYDLPVTGEALASRVEQRLGMRGPLVRLAMDAVSAGYCRPRPRRVPRGGSITRASVSTQDLLPLYEGMTGYGLVQQPDPDVLRWMTGGSWSGTFERLTFQVQGRLRGWVLTRAYAGDVGPDADIVEIFAPNPTVDLYTWMISEAAISLMASHPRRVRARASCPILRAALLANRFRRLGQDRPIYSWPSGANPSGGAIHFTLNHADAPLLPYEIEAKTPVAGSRPTG